MGILESGNNKGYKATVGSDGRLATRSVTNPESVHAAEIGRAYNINTGIITISGASASAVLYFKNDEEHDVHIGAIAAGFSSGTSSESALITVIGNPTAGDIISDASPVSINQNRNLGSANSLLTTTLAYKGKDGGTVTGGNDLLLLYQTLSGRLFTNIDIIVPRGKSVAITIDPNLDSGTVDIYAALIIHVEEAEQ